jgi:DNA-binding IclR family transcriptional regulator
MAYPYPIAFDIAIGWRTMARPALSAARALKLVNYLAAHPGEEFSMSELARNTGVNVASMHALLAVLSAEGYVTRDRSHKRYRLGLSPIAVGQAALEQHPVIARAREAGAELAGRLGLECLTGVVAGEEFLIVGEAGREERLHLRPRVGQRLPFTPPLGVLAAAFADDAGMEAWLDRLGPSASRATRAAYRRAAVRARERGYEIGLVTPTRQAIGEVLFSLGREPDDAELRARLVELVARLGRERHQLLEPAAGEHYLVDNISAPVFDADGALVAGVTLLGFDAPLSGPEVERVAADVLATATEITRASGGRPPPGDRL